MHHEVYHCFHAMLQSLCRKLQHFSPDTWYAPYCFILSLKACILAVLYVYLTYVLTCREKILRLIAVIATFSAILQLIEIPFYVSCGTWIKVHAHHKKSIECNGEIRSLAPSWPEDSNIATKRTLHKQQSSVTQALHNSKYVLLNKCLWR